MDSMTDISERPEFFMELDVSDKLRYINLQNKLENIGKRSGRNMKTKEMEEAFEKIRKFVEKGDDKDSIRAVVCGLVWLPTGLGININQLQCLVRKCKSSFNSTMRKMGYEVSQFRGDASDDLIKALPLISNNAFELRKWSVRSFPKSDPDNMPMPSLYQCEKKKTKTKTKKGVILTKGIVYPEPKIDLPIKINIEEIHADTKLHNSEQTPQHSSSQVE